MLKALFSPRFFGVFLITSIFFQDFSFSKSLIQNEVGASHGHSHGDGSAPEANGEASSHASDFWKDSKNVSASNGCPSYLLEKVKEDSKIGIRNWVGKKSGSSDDYCSNALSKLTDTPDAAELSKRLASHPMTSFGDKGESLSESCLSSVQDPERKKLLVAEYHSNTARLKVASISSLESMAAIDSLLGKNSLQDVDCSQSGMPRMEANCKKLKSCQARGGLEQQAKEIQDIYPQYIALKKEVSNLNSSNALSAMSMGPGYVSNPAQISAMKERSDKSSENQKKILALEAMYPALTGKGFKSTFETSKQNFQEALRSQLEKSREKISEQFNDYQKGIRCMSGKGGSCDHFDKTMKSAPPLNIQAFKRGEGLSVEDSHVQAYLGAVECRQKIREVHENQNEALKDLALGTALTVGTMGLGSVAATAKLASTSAKTAAQAAQFGSRARMASNALVGVDLISLGQGGKEAYEHCSKSLNQLSGAQPKNDSSKTESSCPSDSGSSAIPQLSADYRACVAQVLLQGVTNGLPLVPGAVAGAKNVLGSAEKGALSAEKSLAREGAVLEKEASSEVRGLASSHRDAEARVLDMSPEKKLQIAENMNLSDVDRSAKIAKEMGLASSDPRVQDLMKLHSDPRFSKTLEGSTDELQKKITAGMEVMYPGYQNMDGPARNALASERVKMKGMVANGVLGEASSNVSYDSLLKPQEKTVIEAMSEKMSKTTDPSYKLGIAKSEIERALKAGNLQPEEVAQRALSNLKENSEISNIMSRPGDNRVKELREIASFAGDRRLVNETTRAYVQEFLAKNKHLKMNEAEAASYIYRFEDIEASGVSMAKMTGKKLEAAELRKKALIEEYPSIADYVKKYEAKVAENSSIKPTAQEPVVRAVTSTPAPVSNPAPAVSAPAPKATVATQTQSAAPSVTAPSKTPEVSPPQTALTPPKPKPPANASAETLGHLQKMDTQKGLNEKLSFARLASDTSRNNGGGASVDVAQHALGKLKEVDPEFIKNPLIRDNLGNVNSVVEIAAQAKDDALLKEAMRLKMVAEAKKKYNRMPAEGEIQGWGGEFLQNLEKQARDPSVFKDPAKLERVRRQQRVLYQLSEDNMAYRDPNKSLKRDIEDFFKTQK